MLSSDFKKLGTATHLNHIWVKEVPCVKPARKAGFFMFFMKRWYYISLLVLLLSCEREVSIAPNDVQAKLVVEGEIMTGLPPRIILTQSQGFFTTLDPARIQGQFVRNARVTIIHNNQRTNLRLYEESTPAGFNFSYYAPDSTVFPVLIGIRGQSYQLEIEWQGQFYRAATTIPNSQKRIDSLWWVEPPRGVPTSKAVMIGKITDPPGFGDYIRYFIRRNREPFLPGENSVFDDRIVDGRTYEVQIDPGVNRNLPPATTEEERLRNNFFSKGDTITVQFMNIDRATFNFWNTWEFNSRSVGNPFSQPGVVIGNISNGALGTFSGYHPSFHTLIIPK